MSINTDFLERCVGTLEAAHAALPDHEPDSVMYDIYRAACVKEFELALEQSGKLLKKRLRPYFASNRQADRLNFKDCFRQWAGRPSFSHPLRQSFTDVRREGVRSGTGTTGNRCKTCAGAAGFTQARSGRRRATSAARARSGLPRPVLPTAAGTRAGSIATSIG